eukprot:COSAG02_NODE_20847_length_813_cov_1.390756_1_plen_75_part_10
MTWAGLVALNAIGAGHEANGERFALLEDKAAHSYRRKLARKRHDSVEGHSAVCSPTSTHNGQESIPCSVFVWRSM